MALEKIDTVGIYFEDNEGKILCTYGWKGSVDPPIVMYYYDDGEGGREITVPDALEMWKCERRDLKDFPNARDPKLPYVFDLHWDIKHHSELKKQLEFGHKDLDEMKNYMREHGITFEMPEENFRHYKLHIDGPDLRKQRAALLSLRDRSSSLSVNEIDALDGLNNLLDEIADQAHDKHGIECLL